MDYKFSDCDHYRICDIIRICQRGVFFFLFYDIYEIYSIIKRLPTINIQHTFLFIPASSPILDLVVTLAS